jgi:hypothetical protein
MSNAPNFQEAFNYSQAAVARSYDKSNDFSAIDEYADVETLKKLRERILKEDHLRIDGDERLLGLGSMGVVTKPSAQAGNHPPEDLPGAIARLEYLTPMEHAIVLKAAFSKQYEEENMLGEKYKLLVVPYAPDLPDKPVTTDDIKRTLQVLKAEHLDQTLWDMRPGAFSFLKSPEGALIRYPDTQTVPEDFRGKPIAFVRDLNAMDESLTQRDDTGKALPQQKLAMNLRTWLEGYIPDYSALPPAPRECVEACKQQYATTAALADTLRKHGVTPNTTIPGAPARQEQAQATEYGRGQAEDLRRA